MLFLHRNATLRSPPPQRLNDGVFHPSHEELSHDSTLSVIAPSHKRHLRQPPTRTSGMGRKGKNGLARPQSSKPIRADDNT